MLRGLRGDARSSDYDFEQGSSGHLHFLEVVVAGSKARQHRSEKTGILLCAPWGVLAAWRGRSRINLRIFNQLDSVCTFELLLCLLCVHFVFLLCSTFRATRILLQRV
jgi:hypothetical protein